MMMVVSQNSFTHTEFKCFGVGDFRNSFTYNIYISKCDGDDRDSRLFEQCCMLDPSVFPAVA